MPAYIKWRKRYETNKTELSKVVSSLPLNSIVFNKEVGFSVLRNHGKDFLLLEKPGFPWDDIANTNVLKFIYPQSQIIVFKN